MYLKYIIPFLLLSGSHVKAQVGQETYHGKDLDYEHYYETYYETYYKTYYENDLDYQQYDLVDY